MNKQAAAGEFARGQEAGTQYLRAFTGATRNCDQGQRQVARRGVPLYIRIRIRISIRIRIRIRIRISCSV